MSEILRSKDDGSEARPYGRNSVCGTCKYGKAWVECQHSWRSPLDKAPDFDEEKGPIRVYVVKHNCEHPKMTIIQGGFLCCPTMHDIVKCEMREPRS